MSANSPIKRLKIEGFKSIREMDLELGDLNVLIGANGAGKSNFISFFDMMKAFSSNSASDLDIWLKRKGGRELILHFGSQNTREIRIDFQIDSAHAKIILEPTINDQIIIGQNVDFLNLSPHPFYVPEYHDSSLLSVREAIRGWKLYHFHDTGDTALVKGRRAIQDNVYLRFDASNLAAFLHRLKIETPDTYSQIVKTIQLAIPFFDDFDLRPEELPSGQRQIELLWRQRNSDYPFHPSQLSDGSLRFICLVTALLQPDPPSTIIIDEPELGLHPYAITLLAALLQSASARMQVIVATQSMALVNEFEVKDLIVVDRVDECSVFKRLDEAEFKSWREDYSTGELWEKNIFGGIPRR